MKIETVAEITVFYKGKYLTSLIFDKKETAEKIFQGFMVLLGENASELYTFQADIKEVYTDESIASEISGFAEGKFELKGSILDMILDIDKSEN